jgi:Tetratricopeptide repeat
LYELKVEYAKAEPLYQEALRIDQKVLGKEDPETAANLDDLARLYELTGEFAKGELLAQETLRIRKKVFGKEHPNPGFAVSNQNKKVKDFWL